MSTRLSPSNRATLASGLCMAVAIAGMSVAASAQIATLEDYWEGHAEFQLDASGVGSGFGFHFPSMIQEAGQIQAWYISGYTIGNEMRYTTSRARSVNGLSWTNDGMVLDVGGAWEHVFEAETLSHGIGRADADGWSANTADDSAGYLCYGPYTTAIGGGPNTASFRLLIDDNGGFFNPTVVTLDVYDADSGQTLASRDIRRHDFPDDNTYEIFNVNFTSVAGHRLEFRTYWHDRNYIRQDLVAVATGSYPFWDGKMASFPGVWKDSGTYYLVYEGAGGSPGDIGLATSVDGLNFTRNVPNPILVHNSSGWERANIGTPSLYRENGTWYLYYHGFDGTDCRVGVATGASLSSLTKYGGNPIIDTASGAWDAGTIGRRSMLIKEGDYYYMAYEGSTDQPYDTARWSTGLARSSDLLHWTKCPRNPVIAQTVSGFGNDGPEMIKISGVTYLYVRSGPTDRYRLVYTGPANQPPTVAAGDDQTITLPASAALDATVGDDGLPDPPGAVSVAWTKRSGPGTVTFGNAASVDTTATFSHAGVYVLRLTASDSASSTFDELTVTVNPSPTSVPGDFDEDLDVDQEDFATLQLCLSDVLPVPLECVSTDLNLDMIVDGDDVLVFLDCMTGADVAGDPTCAD